MMMSLSMQALPSCSNRMDPHFPGTLGLSTRDIPSRNIFFPNESVRKDDLCWMRSPERALIIGLMSFPQTFLSTTIVYLPPRIRSGPIWLTASATAFLPHSEPMIRSGLMP